MKKIPKGDYTKRLDAIYDALRFNADERFFADIVAHTSFAVAIKKLKL